MIITNKNASYEDRVNLVSEKIFSFDNDILPVEESEQFKNIIKRIAGKMGDNKTIKPSLEEMNKLFEKLEKVMIETGTKMQSFIYSTGGSRDNKTDETQSQRLDSAGSKTEYFIFTVPAEDESKEIVIIEPIGQKNNATFIGEKVEGIEKQITKCGRAEILTESDLCKIIHDSNGRDSGYNFESEQLFNLIEMARKNPSKLLQVASEKNKIHSLSTIKGKVYASMAANSLGISQEEIEAKFNEIEEANLGEER